MAELYRMYKSKHNPPKDPKTSFAGRNIIITGANTGIGLEAAVKFVALDAAKVILGVRSLDKGQAAKSEIETRTGRKDCIEVWPLDMLDYSSITAFAERAKTQLEHLDIAVLNAGVVFSSFELSKYGWEKTLQVNMLSTTLLALLLLPKLRTSKTAAYTPVLELVGSGNHYAYPLSPADQAAPHIMQCFNTASRYTAARAYGTSKLFLMYSLGALAALAKSPATGAPDVFVTVVCPGPTKSSLARDFSGAFKLVVTLFRRETEEGARMYISGAALGKAGHGRFWSDDKVDVVAPLLTGETGARLQRSVWDEAIESLAKQVPEVKTIASTA